jgi:adenylosuccinate synthase
MKAWAVIGAQYGDESKGKMVDYLCDKHKIDLVVRHNGGAQAGHTVVTPGGRRHVFHHFGSGTLLCVPTYLGRYFVCNPILFNQEFNQIEDLKPRVFVDPACLVTTPWDMKINQLAEEQRGGKRHGSCGVGFNETIERSQSGDFTLRVMDLMNHEMRNATIKRIIEMWVPYRLNQLGIDKTGMGPYLGDAMYGPWCLDAGMFMGRTHMITGKPLVETVVFEGAQGLLLDQNSDNFPHVTRSNTGIKNVVELCKEWGCEELDAVYCTRTYLTRHGAGPLPREDPAMSFEDETNVKHDYQGTLRFAPLDVEDTVMRCMQDSYDHQEYLDTINFMGHFAVSHVDQLSNPEMQVYGSFVSDGPSRDCVEEKDQEMVDA